MFASFHFHQLQESCWLLSCKVLEKGLSYLELRCLCLNGPTKRRAKSLLEFRFDDSKIAFSLGRLFGVRQRLSNKSLDFLRSQLGCGLLFIRFTRRMLLAT